MGGTGGNILGVCGASPSRDNDYNTPLDGHWGMSAKSSYKAGDVIDVSWCVSADHGGIPQFRLCDDEGLVSAVTTPDKPPSLADLEAFAAAARQGLPHEDTYLRLRVGHVVLQRRWRGLPVRGEGVPRRLLGQGRLGWRHQAVDGAVVLGRQERVVRRARTRGVPHRRLGLALGVGRVPPGLRPRRGACLKRRVTLPLLRPLLFPSPRVSSPSHDVVSALALACLCLFYVKSFSHDVSESGRRSGSGLCQYVTH